MVHTEADRLGCPYCLSFVYLGYKHGPDRWKCYDRGHVGTRQQLVIVPERLIA